MGLNVPFQAIPTYCGQLNHGRERSPFNKYSARALQTDTGRAESTV